MGGWGAFDAHILRLGIMRYGCGSWVDLSRHFPGKNKNQLNGQTQRLFGQQALNEFSKLHIDPNKVKEENDKNTTAFRKNTCIINTGNNLTPQQLKKKQAENLKNYGIPQSIYERIVVPLVLDKPKPCVTLVDELEKLHEMYRCVLDIEIRLDDLKKHGANVGVAKAKTVKRRKQKENKAANANTNTNKKPEVQVEETSDIKMDGGAEMDPEMAMAMALSASMENANIDTPAIEKKAKKASKQSTAKKSKKGATKKKKASTKSRRSKKRKKNGRW